MVVGLSKNPGMRTGALLLFVLLGCSTVDGSLEEPEWGMPDYDRKEWKHWIDADKDCQDARQEVLIRDSLEPVVFKTERECKVVTGKWKDVYSSTIITEARLVDVDHVVALRDAHESGGYLWTKDQRKAFANDLEHLVVSSQSTNRSKGARGPDQWLPPLEEYRCQYIDEWLEVKSTYALELSCAEEATINQMKKTCLAGQVPVQPQN